jgi:hypothetical protein
MKAKPFLFLSALLTLSAATYPQSRGGGAISSQTSAAASPSAGSAAAADIGKASNWDALVRQGRPGDYLAGNVKITGGPGFEIARHTAGASPHLGGVTAQPFA